MVGTSCQRIRICVVLPLACELLPKESHIGQDLDSRRGAGSLNRRALDFGVQFGASGTETTDWCIGCSPSGQRPSEASCQRLNRMQEITLRDLQDRWSSRALGRSLTIGWDSHILDKCE